MSLLFAPTSLGATGADEPSGEDLTRLTSGTIAKPEGHPKLERALAAQLDAFNNADGPQATTRVTVRAAPGVSGGELSSTLKTDGFTVGAAGRRDVDVTVSLSDLSALAERADVGFVRTPRYLEPQVTSEGVAATSADLLHAVGRTGTGVNVAVFDTGFDPSDPEIASNVEGTYTFGGVPIQGADPTHGTACAEIIVDMAPNVGLHLVRTDTLTELEAAFLWAIDNDIDVISASVGSSFGPFDGTSDVSDALTQAANAGILISVAAGNEAESHWYGGWQDSDGDNWLNFAGADETINIPVVAGQTIGILLAWDNWQVSDQDYDLYLLDSSLDPLNPLDASLDPQTGTQEAVEYVEYASFSTQTLHLAINRWSASGSATFELFAINADLGEYQVAGRSIIVPADAVGAVSVGAADYAGGHALHSYSSQGPTADGRLAPLVVSASGTSTSSYSPQAFYGTSAAAPHVAGILAAIKQEAPAHDYDDLVPILQAASTDTGAGGVDDATGYGWLDAYNALFLVDITPPGPVGGTYIVDGATLTLSLEFSDYLDSAGSVTLRHGSGSTLTLSTNGIDGKVWTGSANIPSDLPEGTFTLDVSGFTDWALNTQTSTDSTFALVLDIRAPEITLGPAPAAANAAFNVPWTVVDHASAPAVTVERNVDGAGWTTWYTSSAGSETPSWTNATHGQVTEFRIQAVDEAGNTATSPVVSTLTDTALPVLSIVSPTAGAVLPAIASFEASAEDALSGLASLGAKLDGVDIDFVQGEGAAWTHELTTTLAEGEHTLQLTATDEAGNAATLSVPFTIDATAPEIIFSQIPTAGISPNGDGSRDTVKFSFTSNELVNGSLVVTSGETVIRSLEITETEGRDVEWDGRNTTGDIVPEGSYALALTLRDASGLEVTRSVTTTLDLVPPTLTVESPTNGLISNAVELAFDLAGADEGSGLESVAIVDAGGLTQAQIIAAMTDLSLSEVITGEIARSLALFEGAHLLTIAVMDAAGNVISTEQSVQIDRTPPTLPTTAPAAFSPNGDGRFDVWGVTVAQQDMTSLQFRVHTDPHTAPLSQGYVTSLAGFYEVSWEGRDERVDGGGEVRADSTYYIGLSGSDAAGNTVESLYPVVLDTTAPTAALTTPAGFYNGPIGITWSTSDSGAGLASTSVVLQKDADAPVTLSTEAQGTMTYTDIVDGSTYEVALVTEDSVGNVRSTSSGNIQIDLSAPTLNYELNGLPGLADWYVGPVSITLTGSDGFSGVGQIRYTLNGVEWTVEGTSADIGLTGDGRHDLEFYAIDLAGNPSQVQAQEIAIDQTPPEIVTHVIADEPTTAGWSRGPVTITAIAEEAGSGLVDFTYALSGASPTAVPETLTISDEGRHELTLKARDAAGNEVTQTIQHGIDATPPSVAIAAIEPARPPVGSTATITLAATDAFLADAFVLATSPSGVEIWFPSTTADGVVSVAAGPFFEAGEWTFQAFARDLAANLAESEVSTAATADGTPPNVAIIDPANYYISGVVEVDGLVLDDSATTILVEVDGNTIGETLPVILDTTTLANGPHSLRLTATDEWGNAREHVREYFVANAPSISDVALVPESPETEPIEVRALIPGNGLTTMVIYESSGAMNVISPETSLAEDGRQRFVLGSLPHGTHVTYAVYAVDSLGIATRSPEEGFYEFSTAPSADPDDWIDGLDGGSGETIDHAFADIVTSRFLHIGRDAAFGMQMRGPLDYSQPALYIINFDTDGDGASNYNLTATYAPGESPVTWSTTWNSENVGALPIQPPVRLNVGASQGIVTFTVSLQDLRSILGAATQVKVEFRTLGSEDRSSLVTVDVIPPVAGPVATASAPVGQDLVLQSTITDASAIARAVLTYQINSGTIRDASPPTVAGSTYSWTIPSADLSAGILSWFVTAEDAAGNVVVSAKSTTSVIAAALTGSLQLPTNAEQARPQTLQVTGLGASVRSVSWTFGDGVTAAGTLVTHTYSNPGSYPVTATLSDGLGAQTVLSGTLAVQDILPPTVVNDVPLTVSASELTFPIRASDAGGIALVEVSFNDGVTWTPVAGTTSWTATWDTRSAVGTTASAVVRARATDGIGLRAEAPPRVVTIDGIAPVARAGADISALTGAPVVFSGVASSDNFPGLTYTWDLGDGTTATGDTVTKTYSTVGSFSVTLTVTDAVGNRGTDTVAVTITAPPPPPPPPLPPAPAPAPAPAPPAAPPSVVTPPADVVAPTITAFEPTGIVPTRTPTIRATYADDVGVLASSVWLIVDGTNFSVSPSATLVEYTPANPLSAGEHVVMLIVLDAAGNRATQEWRFTIEVDSSTVKPTAHPDNATAGQDLDDLQRPPRAESGTDELPRDALRELDGQNATLLERTSVNSPPTPPELPPPDELPVPAAGLWATALIAAFVALGTRRRGRRE